MIQCRSLIPLAAVLLVTACSQSDQQRNAAATQDQQEGDPAFPVGASGKLISPGGNELGSALASDGPGGVVVRIDARGLQPGTHGVQVHSSGKCQGPNFVSAGPRRDGKAIPNVTIQPDGLWNQTLTIEGVKLSDLRDEDGSSLVLHLNPDSPPADQSGNAGDRIACAVI